MNKYFKNFAITWLAGVILFSLITLVINIETKDVFPGVSFWISYVLVIAAFAIQFIAAKKFFSEENKDKVFLNMPLMTISKSCIIVSVILATIIMIIPGIPYYISVVVAAAIVLFNIVSLVNASSAATAVEEIGQKVAIQTEFIKEMTVKAQNIVAKAKTEDGKAIANKVYEAIRYSNKSSHGGLQDIENKISANIMVFSDAVSVGDDALAKSIGDQLIKLAEERDNLAKLNK